MNSAALVPLLLVVFPLAMAGGCLVLRRTPRIVLAAGLIALAIEGWLALGATVPPGSVLESSVAYDGLGRIMLPAVCAGAFLATMAAAAGEHGEYFVVTELLIVSCSACIALAREPLLVAGLLLAGGLLGGVQLADRPAGSVELIRPRTLGLALRYTVLIGLGGMLMLLGVTLLGGTTAQPATGGLVMGSAYGMLLFGYAVRCGLAPFHVSLGDIMEDAPPSTAALHAGLLAVLALPVLLIVVEAQPQLLGTSGRRGLLVLGAVSAPAAGVLGTFAGARRALAYLASANLGLLTIGLGLGTPQGVEAALLGAVGHILGTGLAALGLALLPCAHGSSPRPADTGSRWAGALTLVLGVLLLVGVPPLAGFASKLLLLAAAWQSGYLVAAIVVAGITLMALAAGRLLSEALRPPAAGVHDMNEPVELGAPNVARVSRVLLLAAVAVALAAAVGGIWLPPASLMGEAVGGLLP